MGVCQSCLGRTHSEPTSDQSDTSQLLNDHYQPGYGSINNNQQHGGFQPDPEEIRRQRDALERICAQTTDKLIDILYYPNPDLPSKMALEYPRMFAERFRSRTRSDSDESEELLQEQDSWLDAAVGRAGDNALPRSGELEGQKVEISTHLDEAFPAFELETDTSECDEGRTATAIGDESRTAMVMGNDDSLA